MGVVTLDGGRVGSAALRGAAELGGQVRLGRGGWGGVVVVVVGVVVVVVASEAGKRREGGGEQRKRVRVRVGISDFSHWAT